MNEHPPDDHKVIDLAVVRVDREELAICRLWDNFQSAAVTLYDWRDYESLVALLQSIEAVKRHIEK